MCKVGSDGDTSAASAEYILALNMAKKTSMKLQKRVNV